MSLKYRYRMCASCKTWIHGRFPLRGPVYCLECNLAHAHDAAVQMANKQGPYYDKWLSTRGPRGRPTNDQNGG